MKERLVSKTIRKIDRLCDETGHFPSGWRRYAAVGEWSLALDGIYRFVEGNPEFKQSLGEDYLWLIKKFKHLNDFKKLPIYPWEP